MKIYLVRHGETDWNRMERMQGQADNELNDTGRRQAQIVADALRGIRFDAAFSSTLIRAVTTAQIILGERSNILRQDPRIMEIGFGPWEGERIAKVMQEEHPLHFFFTRPDQYFPPVGAESFYHLYARSEEFMNRVILPMEETVENVLIVGHGAWNRSILNPVKNIPLAEFWSCPLENCAVEILELTQDGIRVMAPGGSKQQ